MAVPIILGWILLVAVLSLTVSQLEVVSQMRSVSMAPAEAPSVIAMTPRRGGLRGVRIRQFGRDRVGGEQRR